MKFSIAVILVILSLLWVDVTWAAVIPRWPVLDFQGRAIAINRICSSGSSYRTIDPQNICIESKIIARYACNGETCRLISSASALRRGEFFRVGRECLRFETMTLSIDRFNEGNYIVPLIEDDVVYASPVVGTFRYTIPSCK